MMAESSEVKVPSPFTSPDPPRRYMLPSTWRSARGVIVATPTAASVWDPGEFVSNVRMGVALVEVAILQALMRLSDMVVVEKIGMEMVPALMVSRLSEPAPINAFPPTAKSAAGVAVATPKVPLEVATVSPPETVLVPAPFTFRRLEREIEVEEALTKVRRSVVLL